MELTRDNYHSTEADLGYMRNSQFGDFMDCEAMAFAKYVGKVDDDGVRHVWTPIVKESTQKA